MSAWLMTGQEGKVVASMKQANTIIDSFYIHLHNQYVYNGGVITLGDGFPEDRE